MPLTSGTPKWQKVATFVLLSAILLLAVVIFLRVGTTNAAVDAVGGSVDRTDCARRVSGEQATVRDKATLADRAARRYFDRVLLDTAVNGTQATPATRDERVREYTALVNAADNADKAVAALPDPAKEVERRCPE